MKLIFSIAFCLNLPWQWLCQSNHTLRLLSLPFLPVSPSYRWSVGAAGWARSSSGATLETETRRRIPAPSNTSVGPQCLRNGSAEFCFSLNHNEASWYDLFWIISWQSADRVLLQFLVALQVLVTSDVGLKSSDCTLFDTGLWYCLLLYVGYSKLFACLILVSSSSTAWIRVWTDNGSVIYFCALVLVLVCKVKCSLFFFCLFVCSDSVLWMFPFAHIARLMIEPAVVPEGRGKWLFCTPNIWALLLLGDKDCVETVKWQVMKVPFKAQGLCRYARTGLLHVLAVWERAGKMMSVVITRWIWSHYLLFLATQEMPGYIPGNDESESIFKKRKGNFLPNT